MFAPWHRRTLASLIFPGRARVADRFAARRILLDPDPDNGGGTGSGGGGGGSGSGSGGSGDGDTEGYREALRKHRNDAAVMARAVYADNEALRGQLAALRGQVPASGSRVLSAEDAALVDEVLALGGTEGDAKARAAALRKAIEERGTFAAEIAQAKRDRLTADAAALLGFDPDVLRDLPGFAGLELEIREEGTGAKTKKVPHVKLDGKDVPLVDHAAKVWPKFLPALKATAKPDAAAHRPTPVDRRAAAATGTNGASAAAADRPAAPNIPRLARF
jgi:hypothetical protein